MRSGVHPYKSRAVSMLTRERQYIGGAWVASDGPGELIDVHDSNTGEVFARVIAGSKTDMDKAVESAAAAFPSWSRTTLAERKAYLEKILAEYMSRKDQVSEALQRELGAPKVFAEKVQSMMFPAHFQTTLGLADEFEWSHELGPGTRVVKEPIGVVGCITPWNWPLNQIAAKIAPALLAGCTVVLKPSEITPLNAYIVADAIHAAGLPAGVFNMVSGTGPDCGEVLATHPKVDMVSFTGSTAVGRHLHALGSATLKRVRSELGGKSATVVLEDATPDQIKLMASSVLGNTGQSCNALSRMLAPRSRYDEVVAIAKEAFDAIRVVDATDPDAPMGTMGPLASRSQYEKVTGYMRRGVEEGARLITGGADAVPAPGLPAGGFFVRPTVFADAHNAMTIAQEEIFGPVLTIIPYDSEEEAIAIANDTIYGLNNAVAGSDETRAMDVASRLRSGQVQVNTSHPNMMAPFGGYKQSGDGREWGRFGLEEFLQIKAINKAMAAKL